MDDFQDGDLTHRNIVSARLQLLHSVRIWADYQDSVEAIYTGHDLRYSTYSKFQKRLFSYYVDLEGLNRLLTNSDFTMSEFGVIEFKSKKDLIKHHFIFNRWDFFVGMFGLFEDAVCLIFNQIISPAEQNKLSYDLRVLAKNSEIMEEIKNQLPTHYEQIKKTLSEKDSFIPFKRKLLKLNDQEILSDANYHFCEFVSLLRNTIHSNGYYNGKEDKPFKDILGEDFMLKSCSYLNFITVERCISWANELIRIFRDIADHPNTPFVLDETFNHR